MVAEPQFLDEKAGLGATPSHPLCRKSTPGFIGYPGLSLTLFAFPASLTLPAFIA